jgi:riboflavin kinase/FMN adenylyltransferase
VPADGVYATFVEIKGKKYGGMLNIGNNPTVPGKGRSIEINIFDFNEDIYNQNINIAFVEKLREEKTFDGLDALKTQLHIDKLQTLAIINAQCTAN